MGASGSGHVSCVTGVYVDDSSTMSEAIVSVASKGQRIPMSFTLKDMPATRPPATSTKGAMPSPCSPLSSSVTFELDKVIDADLIAIIEERLKARTPSTDLTANTTRAEVYASQLPAKAQGSNMDPATIDLIEAGVVAMGASATEVASYNAVSGDIAYVANQDEVGGMTLVLPDGRKALPQRLMLDSGSDIAIIDAEYAKSLGLTWSPAPHFKLNDVHCNLKGVVGVTPLCTLVLAKGTPYEASLKCRFFVLEGVGTLYEVLIGQPQLRPHGAYQDPINNELRYRPFWQSRGDSLHVHGLPLKAFSRKGHGPLAQVHRLCCPLVGCVSTRTHPPC